MSSSPANQASPEAVADSESANSAVDSVRASLATLKDRWHERHGEVVAELEVDLQHGRPLVTGQVLVPSQRDALERALSAAHGNDGVVIDVTALTDLDSTAGDWYRTKAMHVDVFAAPRGNLATQWERNEPPLRVLANRSEWAAVELCDRTVGWVTMAELEEIPDADADAAPESVVEWRTAWQGSPSHVSLAAWQAAIAEWLHVPYLLGGRLKAGLDCSGLTQRVYKEAASVGLPRHSRDQARCGTRIPRAELASGDLLYLTHIERGVSHTALHLGGGPQAMVVHASFDHGAVVIEERAAFLERYLLRTARRIALPSDAHA